MALNLFLDTKLFCNPGLLLALIDFPASCFSGNALLGVTWLGMGWCGMCVCVRAHALMLAPAVSNLLHSFFLYRVVKSIQQMRFLKGLESCCQIIDAIRDTREFHYLALTLSHNKHFQTEQNKHFLPNDQPCPSSADLPTLFWGRVVAYWFFIWKNPMPQGWHTSIAISSHIAPSHKT